MKATSWRHHYIPQFYLKGFLNENDKFKIYNTVDEKFIKKGKDFSTESYFFEKDSNTVISNDEKDDFLEDFYGQTDNSISTLFDKIRNSQNLNGFGLTDAEMPALQYFIATLFWRNPKNFHKIKKLVSSSYLKDLGITLRNEKDEIVEDKTFEKQLKDDPNFIKGMKFMIPNITYPRILGCRTPLHIQSFPKGLPSLCSDYPIIFRNQEDPDVYRDDLIFPLTNDLVFIRSSKINNISTTIKVEIDLIILKQAMRYVSCTDQTYIYMLQKFYKENYNNPSELIDHVFSELID
jgi:hypothetical protein